jgi:hypothetical protein
MFSGPFSSAAFVIAFAAGACFRPFVLEKPRLAAVPAEPWTAVVEQELPVAAAAPPETQVHCVCDCRPLLERADPSPGPPLCTFGGALLASVEVRLGLVAVSIAIVAFLCGWCCRRGASRERRPTTALARLDGYR